MLLTDPVGLIERADATIQAVGEINDDGMGRVFAANVFGHYVMVITKIYKNRECEGSKISLYPFRCGRSSHCCLILKMAGLCGPVPLQRMNHALISMTGKESKGIRVGFYMYDEYLWLSISSLVPYESSKWACDLISVACHDRFQKENLLISSFTTSPGVVASNIGDLPYWVTELRKLLHYLVR